MPKSKKKVSSTSDSDSGPDDHAPPPKKTKDPEKSDDGNGGNNTWVLDKQRQIRVNEFRGRKLVDIREFYEKDGKVLPGKKGISLSVIQWKKLLEVAKDVNLAIGEND